MAKRRRTTKQSSGSTEGSTSLLKLAQKKLGELTQAEQLMFEKAEEGEMAVCGFKRCWTTAPDGTIQPPIIRADRIAWLCTDAQAKERVTHRGIWVKAARIEGPLDLPFARIAFPLAFDGCAFADPIDLIRAEVRGLYLNGSHTKSIAADGAKVEGDVNLRNGFSATGEVRLLGASIGGDLDCTKGTFSNPGGYCLSADRVNVEGNVDLRDGFSATGEVRLLGASIGGDLSCIKATFSNPKHVDGDMGYALNADGVKVEGNVFLSVGFSATGEVRLLGASIGGDLDCNNGTFSNPKRKDDDKSYALNADRVRVEGAVNLRDGFTAAGEVRLLGASIGGNLACSKGTFSNPGGSCLIADGVKVEGSVLLREGFEGHGRVSLVAAEVKRHFQWRGGRSPAKATMDLRSAKLGTLWDDQKSWPAPGNLYLQGLEYAEIGHKAPTDVGSRITWLRLQPEANFTPQPYEQLAAVLKKQGHDQDAKDILVAKNEDPAFRKGMPWWREGWYRLYGFTTGYGHDPLRAWKGFLLFLVLGCMFFGLGWRCGLITPSEVDAYIAHEDAGPREIAKDYPKFNFIMYSIDSFVPIVDFHQQGYWLPNPNKGVILPCACIPVSWGGFLRLYLWFHIVAGWFLTTLFAVGLTGLIRS